MKRFQDSAKFFLLVTIIGLASCGYKGPLYLPEKPETNQTPQQDTTGQDEPSEVQEEP